VNAGGCRVGSKICIIGGETEEEYYGGPHFCRSILCFDSSQKEWWDIGIPDFPGRAFFGDAVVFDKHKRILVAGGGRPKYITANMAS